MKLLARMEAVADAAPDRPAYLYAGGSGLSYAELLRQIAALRAALREHVRAGATVLVNLKSSEVPAVFLAGISAGMNVLLVADSAAPAEIASLAERAGASLILSAHGRVAVGLAAKTLHPSDLGGGSGPVPAASTAGELLLATSGSTGEPKIVRRTAASLDAVAANMVEAIGFSDADLVLAAVPLAHSYGLEHGLLAPLWAGASVALCEGLDVAQLSSALEYRPTVFPAVPTMLERLADVGDTLPALSGVRALYSAGAPLPDAVRDRYVERYRTPIGQLYGSTEIGTVTYRPGERFSGVGIPMSGVSVRILEAGEVAICSPSMFSAYVDAPAELLDGHFLTGDLGQIERDGSLVLTGRSKLLIDTGGLKVNPLEVEAVMERHPQVAACVVLPLRQSETVWRLRAVIVPRDASNPPAPAVLRAFARARLAAHKVPRVFETRGELPRSATGKVLRHMLDNP